MRREPITKLLKGHLATDDAQSVDLKGNRLESEIQSYRVGLLHGEEKEHVAVQLAECSRPPSEREEDRCRLITLASPREISGFAEGSADRALITTRRYTLTLSVKLEPIE